MGDADGAGDSVRDRLEVVATHIKKSMEEACHRLHQNHTGWTVSTRALNDLKMRCVTEKMFYLRSRVRERKAEQPHRVVRLIVLYNETTTLDFQTIKARAGQRGQRQARQRELAGWTREGWLAWLGEADMMSRRRLEGEEGAEGGGGEEVSFTTRQRW